MYYQSGNITLINMYLKSQKDYLQIIKENLPKMR
jgi:hypothetical protein